MILALFSFLLSLVALRDLIKGSIKSKSRNKGGNFCSTILSDKILKDTF